MQRMTREERRNQTRERLLDAAQQLFADRGVNASLDDVAAAAGLTKGAVYSNFASKEELLLALIQRRAATPGGCEPANLLADPKMPLENRLNALAVLYGPSLRDPANRTMVLLLMEFWVAAMRSEKLREGFHELLRALRTGVAGELERLGLTERLDRPAEEIAALVVAFDLGLAVQHLIAPEEIPGKLYARSLELLLGDALP